MIEWRPFDPKEFPNPDWPDDVGVYYQLPLGYAARDRDGGVWLVGDINGSGYDFGCGCCSDRIDIVEIADLADDVEGLDR